MVVFVPGFMQRADAWGEVARLVGERYLCVDFATHTLEGRLAEIAAAAGRDDVVAGYSQGGRLALHAALREGPRALILVGCSAGIEDADERARRRATDAELADWIERSPIEQVVARWERQPIFATQSDELVARQRAGRLAHRPGELAELLRTAGQGAIEPVWDRLPRLETPTLLVAGELDGRYVEAARRMAALLPRARVEIVAGAGHAPQLERPRETAAAISRFLRD